MKKYDKIGAAQPTRDPVPDLIYNNHTTHMHTQSIVIQTQRFIKQTKIIVICVIWRDRCKNQTHV